MPALQPSLPKRRVPARFPGSCVPPRRFFPPTAGPFEQAVRSFAAVPSAVSAAQRLIAGTASSRPSVFIVASTLLNTIPTLTVNCSRKLRWAGMNSPNDARANHGLDLIFEKNREHHDASGNGVEQAGVHRNCVVGNLSDQNPTLVRGALTDEGFGPGAAGSDTRPRTSSA